MINSTMRKVSIPLFFAAVTLGGCTHYVKQADFDSAIAELRANDQKQQQQLDSLTQEMQQRFAKYDASIAEMGGRVRVGAARIPQSIQLNPSNASGRSCDPCWR